MTGAANGLGKEIALNLAQKGCHVAIVDIDLEKANEVAQYIVKNYSVKAVAYRVSWN